jgi:hypothetical protein
VTAPHDARDRVGGFLDQWAALDLDMDLDAMGTVSRVLRLSRLLGTSLKDYLAGHAMETGSSTSWPPCAAATGPSPPGNSPPAS